MDAGTRSTERQALPLGRDCGVERRTSRAIFPIDRWSAEDRDGEVLKNRWMLLDFADAAQYRLPK